MPPKKSRLTNRTKQRQYKQAKQNQTEEAANERRVMEAQRLDLKRARESEVEIAIRRTADAGRIASKRASESEIETLIRKKAAAELIASKRARESVVETAVRRVSAARSIASRRVKEAEQRGLSRLAIEAENFALRTSVDGADERQASLSQRCESRQCHTEEERREASSIVTQRQLTRAMLTYRIAINENILDQDVPGHYIGELNDECEFCHSLNFSLEKPLKSQHFSHCCRKGKIFLEPLGPVPKVLSDLHDGCNENAKNFKQNVRKYNSSLAFASFGAQCGNTQPEGRGPYCFRIHGQVYHRTSSIHPDGEETPKYAQLYVIDSSQATQHRMNRNTSCLPHVMEDLDAMLRAHNPYANAYKMMREMEEQEQMQAQVEGREISPIGMFIREDKRDDQRRYNAPRSNEVAIVFRNVDGEPPFDRDIRVYQRNQEGRPFENISIVNSNLDPMTYPLLFPNGERGWAPGLYPLQNINLGNEDDDSLEPCSSRSRKSVTQREFYNYRKQIRRDGSLILHSGQLTQQYDVDSFLKTEGSRLHFLKKNQAMLRCELYSGLMDHINNLAAAEGVTHGKMVILPSSFEGSPRAMQQNYQDAMSIVAKFGRPDLFITVTCNPKWREIIENLEVGERPEDRPDLVARVFNLKLKELKKDIRDRHVLGKHVAMIDVIEFQKRGLPHAHILLILSAEDKIRDRETIDGIVCAEIPDKNENPRLFEVVKNCMIHGPCGAYNPKSPCMDGGTCTKNFPKKFAQGTRENVSGFPEYRRRDTGTQFYVGTRPVDNSWVVPYNKYLLEKYEAHINVEVCSSVKSVKYLFKYVYKGHDAANVVFCRGTDDGGSLEWNEITAFMDCRYCSPPEANWRTFGFPMHEQSHSCIRLAVHCENQQLVYFQEGQEAQAAANAVRKDTTLTAFFKLNRDDPTANEYLYPEIPYHFVFDPKKQVWKKRQRHSKIVSRMYYVSPADEERFYLRLLLLHVRGAKSFQELRTVDGIVCPSFKEAARQRNLLRDDIEWDKCLTEASVFRMPRQLRQLFAVICTFALYICVTLALWMKHKGDLCEDFLRENDTVVAEQMALNEIQDALILQGKKCTDFNLPEPPVNIRVCNDEIFDADTERLEGEASLSMLNSEQRYIYDKIIYAVENDPSNEKCFFVDGPGGSGKTFLYGTIMSVLRGKGLCVLPVAWTGIAATLLKGGRTVHSRFKLPVPILETSTSNMRPNSREADVIRNAKLILWDEATMAPSYALNAVDMLLKDIMKVKRPFGGKVILLGGDFRQCLPVVRHGSRAAIIGMSIKSSRSWRHFNQLHLSTNMRALPEEREFSSWLLELGNGELKSGDEVGDDMIDVTDFSVNGSIISEVFGQSITDANLEETATKAVLCPKNEDTLILNKDALCLLAGTEKIYYSIDSVVVNCDIEAEEEELRNYPLEYLHSLTPTGMPQHKLVLKKNAIIMLLRNLNPRKGLCNGTRMVVRELSDNVINAEIIAGSFKGERVLIPRIELSPSDVDLPFVLKRRQFPVRLAFVMTINKSQGQTFQKVGIYLPQTVFSHGQLYVAFSRVKQKTDISVKLLGSDKQGHLCKERGKTRNVYTRNVVFREIFS